MRKIQITVPENKIRRILFATGILLFISEIWKQITINLVLEAAGPGQYYYWFFPFQLCSTPMYVCLLLPLAEKHPGYEDAALTYLATFGLLAGAFAFCDTSGFSELGYLPLTVHSWCWHIVMILMGLASFVTLVKRERPEGVRVLSGGRPSGGADFFGAAGIFLSGCIIAEIINALVGDRGIINMFYINPRLPMAQVCFKDIALYAGNGWGIAVYILSILLGAAVLYVLLLAASSFRGAEAHR